MSKQWIASQTEVRVSVKGAGNPVERPEKIYEPTGFETDLYQLLGYDIVTKGLFLGLFVGFVCWTTVPSLPEHHRLLNVSHPCSRSLEPWIIQ